MAGKTKTQRKVKPKVKVKPKKTPRTRKPRDMSVEQWQAALRREYGREQEFKMKKLGDEPFFTDYIVRNPERGSTYRVAVRGVKLGDNFCSCPDFAINTLGTCKHIEWLLSKLERKRGGKKAFREGFHPPYSEVYLHYGVKHEVRFQPGTECPKAVLDLARRYFDEDGVLKQSACGVFDRFVRQVSKNDHDVRVYPDALAFVATVRDAEKREKQIDQAFGNGRAARGLDKLLKMKLYPYQREGALFAAKAGRCLLADDMGLGKTIQAIATVEILAKTAGLERVLVVGPTSLKHQWKEEIERFSGRSAQVVEGLAPIRKQIYRDDSFYKITNYDVVHRDIDLINNWQPDMVILDEAQRIKNWQTRRAMAVKQIASDHAIVLTGTPIENRLEELHSIMGFVDRFHLGPLFRFLAEHQHTDEGGRVVGYRNLNRIKEGLAPVLIRRRKAEVLKQLPGRTDKHLFVEMTAEQWTHHDENKQAVGEIVARWRRRGFLTDKEQRRLMVCLQNMRMACNSSYLLDKEEDHSVKLDECSLLLNDILETQGNKVVIFSQWLGTHELLIRRLDGKGLDYAYYHGSLSSKARKETIKRFKQDDACRILLCTDSGGVGLNLQTASAVINMDQPWNPAVLEQRVGRVHRLGQHRSVQVYNFVSQGTIEHGMLSVLKFKSAIFAGVLDGGEGEVFLNGSKMKKFMQTVEEVSDGVPERMPTHAEESAEAEVETGAIPPVPGKAEDSVPSASADAWGEALSKGVDFLGKLGQALQSGTEGGRGAEDILGSLVARNPETGAQELRIPMPDGDTAAKLAGALSGLAGVMQSLSRGKS
jgi:superfamily II DNA or RNA helicase